MQQSNIGEYIKIVCEQIRWKKAHNAISEEIESHIIDQRNAFIDSGLDNKTATEKAIMEMGDPVLVGTELDRSYRPKIEWSVVALTCMLLLTGLVVKYFVINLAPTPFEFSVFTDLFSISVGFMCMFIAYFIDFTIIGKHPNKIFFALTSLLVILNSMNNKGYITSSFILLLFPTAFAGVIYKMRNKSYLGIIQAGLIFSISAIICLNSWNISSIIVYSISCLLLLTMAVLKDWFNVKKSNALLLIYVSVALVSVAFIILLILNKSYMLYRIKAAFNPSLNPKTSGWLIIFVRNVIDGARFFGQGTLGNYTGISLPSIHSDFLLTYLIHKLGWFSFIVIMSIITIFIVRLFTSCKKQKNILAKLISISILITFTIQFVVYVAYNLGFQLLSPLTLPFISYGGTSMVINMTLIGILLSIFNTGDLYRDGKPKYSPNKNRLLECIDGKIIINLNIK